MVQVRMIGAVMKSRYGDYSSNLQQGKENEKEIFRGWNLSLKLQIIEYKGKDFFITSLESLSWSLLLLRRAESLLLLR
jgi:hypothetical protein